MSTLQRRLSTLEAATWDRRKRQTFRDAFADRARDERWTPERFEREIQTALDEFARLEPTLKAMCRQGKTLREVMVWMATELGVVPDELIAEIERRGVLSSRKP